MNRHIVLACVTGLLASAALPACGSSSSSSSGSSFSSGLSKTASLGDLTDADYAKLCAAMDSYYKSDPAFTNARCHATGLGAAALASLLGGASADADLQKACSDAETACKNAPASGGDGGAYTCGKPTGTCTATVGEFEACISDATQAVNASIASAPSCATITKADIGNPLGAGDGGVTKLPTPASCQTVDQKCPSARASTGATTTSG